MTALNLDLLFVGLKSRMSNFTPFRHHQTRAVCCCDKPLRFCRFMVEFFVAVRSNFSQGSSNLTEVWYAPRKLALNKNLLICKFIYFGICLCQIRFSKCFEYLKWNYQFFVDMCSSKFYLDHTNKDHGRGLFREY